MSETEVDIAIIGAGTAGMSAYREARKITDRLALIEGGEFGTTCARVGCMPSKLLIAPAEACHRLLALPEFGVQVGEPRIDGRAVMKRVRDERDRFVGFVKGSVEKFDRSHIFRGHARFEDDTTLALSDGQRIRAGRTIIATGSRPAVLKQFEPAGDRVITSDDVFYWDDLPGSAAVFGAGVIGVELGQALHRLGVRVRLFGMDCLVGPLTDPEVRRYAVGAIGNEVPAMLDTGSVEIRRDGDEVVIGIKEDGGQREERSTGCLPRPGGGRMSTISGSRIPRSSSTTAACRASTRCRPSAATRRSSSPAMPTASCRCCTRPPTTAGWRARTPPPGRGSSGGAGARRSPWSTATRRSPLPASPTAS